MEIDLRTLDFPDKLLIDLEDLVINIGSTEDAIRTIAL